MAAYSAILTALETKLKAFADTNSYPVAWPDVEFTPNGQPYLESFLLPNETAIGGIASDSYMDYGGIFQINVVTPKGRGTIDERTIVEVVLNEFSKASISASGTTSVKIEKSYASGAFDRSDSWRVIPVSVRYRVIE